MEQDEINQEEWENSANWSDSIVGLYFSKRDSRIWVPKRVPSFGWTVSLGHPAGAWTLVGLLAAPWVVAAISRRRG
jgi:uncharacterized membrane protein